MPRVNSRPAVVLSVVHVQSEGSGLNMKSLRFVGSNYSKILNDFW